MRPEGLTPPPSLLEIVPKGTGKYIKAVEKDLTDGRKSDLTAIVAIGFWPAGPWELVVTKDPDNIEWSAVRWKKLMPKKPRVYAMAYIEGRSRAETVKAEIDKERDVYLETVEDMQRLIETAIKDSGRKCWSRQQHCNRVEELAEAREREEMRK